MGDSGKKKNHYTPNFILRGFATTTGRLWVLDKSSGCCWAKDGGPDDRFDAFAENNYNTLLDPAGKRDTSIEDYLEKIEDAAAPIVRDLVDYATAGLYPSLSTRAGPNWRSSSGHSTYGLHAYGSVWGKARMRGGTFSR